jgi:uncharacterized glyoxalase superfamily protein PhnB
MSEIRSGTPIIPGLRYHDAHAAIDWLVRVLGFHKQAVYEGAGNTVAHAQLTLGSGMVMLGSASNTSPYADYLLHPSDAGGRSTPPIYIMVADCDPVYTNAQSQGAQIVQELRTMDYGGKAFTLRDPEGYLWAVGEYDPWVTTA